MASFRGWSNFSKNTDNQARGMAFQGWFKDILEQMNVCYFRLETERKTAQPCDFLVDTEKWTWYIDTKSTKSNKVYWKSFRKSQKEAFAKVPHIKKSNRYGFVVWFEELDTSKNNIRLIEKETKVITPESGTKWDFQMLID